MNPWILVGVFVASSLLGYRVIKSVPSLLHTPLMSGMNALSGITLLGALTITAVLVNENHPILAQAIAVLAIALAGVNVVGGFYVTKRMLAFFKKKGAKS